MANPLGKIVRPLWLRLDKALSGRAQDDPLFLSNRTVTQKMKSWLAVGVPCLIVIAVVTFALTRRGGAKDNRVADLSPAQVAARMLPDYTKTVNLAVDRAVTIDEVQVEHSVPPKLIGVARNMSDLVHSADLLCELETRRGARLGGVTAHLGEIAPHATKKFEVEIVQDTASIAIVREIRIH